MTERSGVIRIVIGLDFGTHSTKCIIRPLGTDKIIIPTFASRNNSERAYPWFAEPSLVRAIEGQLCFGHLALSERRGTLYRSLKMQLLTPVSNRRKHYPPFPSDTSPDLLVACYLSRFLARIKSAVEKAFGGQSVKPLLNMAAPMDHFENETLKLRYLQIINSVWESVFGKNPFVVQNGLSIRDARRYFTPLLDANVEGTEDRPFEVLPETIAPIVSMQNDPRMAPGFYLMLDMGAGTSEFSINLVNARGVDQKVVCYYDSTKPIGGDDFENVEKRGSQNQRQPEEVAHLIKRVTQSVKETCFNGFYKDSANGHMRPKWKHLTLLFTGGAARDPRIQKAVASVLPIPPHLPGEDRFVARWHIPHLPSHSRITQHEASLLAVAHGLSVHRRHWPEVFEPQAVERLQVDTYQEQPLAQWYTED